MIGWSWRRESIHPVGWWGGLSRRCERRAEGGGKRAVCGGAGILQDVDVAHRVQAWNRLLHAGLRRGVCAGGPDAELGDGGLNGADGHVAAEDQVQLRLLSGVRLQRGITGRIQIKKPKEIESSKNYLILQYCFKN